MDMVRLKHLCLSAAENRNSIVVVKFFITSLLCLVVLMPVTTAAEQGPLAVDAPIGWDVEYQGDDGIQFYTVTRKDDENALLMFNRWPVPGGREQIPGLINGMAEAFLKEAKASKEFKLETVEYEIQNLEGEAFSGRFVVFQVEGGFVQTMFMLSDGHGIWNGQFSGSEERWDEAIGILKKLKRPG